MDEKENDCSSLVAAEISIFSPLRSPDMKERHALATLSGRNGIAAAVASTPLFAPPTLPSSSPATSALGTSAVKPAPKIEYAAHLDLLEFTCKPFLDFGTIRPGSEARLFLNVRNPAILPQDCTVDKIPETEHFDCTHRRFTVGASANFPLTFSWKPLVEGAVRATCALRWKQKTFYIVLYGQCSAAAKKRAKTAEPNVLVEIFAAPYPNKATRQSIEQPDAPTAQRRQGAGTSDAAEPEHFASVSVADDSSLLADHDAELGTGLIMESADAHLTSHHFQAVRASSQMDSEAFLVTFSPQSGAAMSTASMSRSFKARPLNRKILQTTVGIPKVAVKPVTAPQPFAFGVARKTDGNGDEWEEQVVEIRPSSKPQDKKTTSTRSTGAATAAAAAAVTGTFGAIDAQPSSSSSAATSDETELHVPAADMTATVDDADASGAAVGEMSLSEFDFDDPSLLAGQEEADPEVEHFPVSAPALLATKKTSAAAAAAAVTTTSASASQLQLSILRASVMHGRSINPVAAGKAQRKNAPLRLRKTMDQERANAAAFRKAQQDTSEAGGTGRTMMVLKEEQWIEKEEAGFTRLLNHIFGSVEDESLAGLSIPRQNQPLASAAAEDAEMRPRSIRRRAAILLEREAMRACIARLETEVDSGRLVLQQSCELVSNVLHRQQFHGLLFSYSLPWLRLGLETVFNRRIVDDGMAGLAHFIDQYLSDSDAIRKAYAVSAGGIFRDGMHKAMLRHTLKHVIVLIAFLDAAKEERLFDSDPCLFARSSNFKSSATVVAELNRLFVSGEGNLVRYLTNHAVGFALRHQQDSVDELDYAVSNLAVDLRDGVRFAKLAEILCGLGRKAGLMKSLRLPAVSRLQKVHNVTLALSTLGIPDVQHLADKITLGDRTSTLLVIWQIVSRWHLPALVNVPELEAETARVSKKVAMRFNTLQYASQPLLQALLSWCQAIVTGHYHLPIANFTTSFSDGRALCYLIHFYQPALVSLAAIGVPEKSTATSTTNRLAREKENKEDGNDDNDGDEEDEASFVHGTAAAGRLAKSGGWVAQFSPTHRPVSCHTAERANVSLAMRAIQQLGGVPLLLSVSELAGTIPDERVVSTLLAFLSTRLLHIRVETAAALKIQHAWRVSCARRGFGRMQRAVLVLQRTFRRQLCRRASRTRSAAAAKIGAMWRMHKCRAEYRRMAIAVRDVLKPVLRAFAVRASLRREALVAEILRQGTAAFLAKRRFLSARRIQAAYRMHVCRASFARLQQAATLVAACHRRNQLATAFQRTRRVAIAMQALRRMAMARRAYLQARCAVVRLQSLARRFVTRSWYLRISAGAHKLRSVRRQMLLAQAARAWLQRRQTAATRIQANWRRQVAERLFTLLRSAALLCQKHARMCAARMSFLRLRSYAIRMQSRVRSKQQQAVFLHQRRCLVRLQATWRMSCARRLFLCQRQGATLVASLWRMQTARRLFLQQRQAAVRLQSVVRMHQAQSQRQKLALARLQQLCATRLQTAWRRYACRKMFLAVRDAAVVCQSCVRRLAAMRQLAVLRLDLHTRSAVRIQAAVRGFVTRTAYQRLRHAIVLAQSLWRMHAAVRLRARLWAEKEVQSAVVIQALFRMHAQRVSLLRLRRATVVCQTMVRGCMARKALAILRHAHATQKAVLLQSVARMFVARLVFLRLKAAAVCCQSLARRKQAGRQLQVLRMEHHRKMATAIQTAFRGFCCRKAFCALRAATVLLQARVRMQAQRQAFLRVKDAAVKLQSVARMHRRRVAFKKLRTAVSLVACRWRYLQQMRQRSSAATRLQAAWRRFVCRSDFVKFRQAVVRLQSIRRMSVAQRQAQALRAIRAQQIREAKEAAVIQSTWRMHVVRRHFMQQMAAIQRMQLRIKARHVLRRLRDWNSAAMRAKREDAARQILHAYRGHQIRMAYLRMQAASLKIQSMWRGHRVRAASSMVKVTNLRKRLRRAHERALANPHLRLSVRTATALSTLLETKQLTTVMNAVASLAVTARLSRSCCERMALEQQIVPVMLSLIHTCNRSQPHMELLKHILDIFRSLASHSSTCAVVLGRAASAGAASAASAGSQDAGHDGQNSASVVETLVDLMQSFRDKSDVYGRAVGVLLVLVKTNTGKVPVSADLTRRIGAILSILDKKRTIAPLSVSTSSGNLGASSGLRKHSAAPSHPAAAAAADFDSATCIDMTRQLLELLRPSVSS